MCAQRSPHHRAKGSVGGPVDIHHQWARRTQPILRMICVELSRLELDLELEHEPYVHDINTRTYVCLRPLSFLFCDIFCCGFVSLQPLFLHLRCLVSFSVFPPSFFLFFSIRCPPGLAIFFSVVLFIHFAWFPSFSSCVLFLFPLLFPVLWIF